MHLRPARLATRRLALRLLALGVAAAACVPGASADEEWRASADVPVHYEIEARLRAGTNGDDGWRIAGKQVVEWQNRSTDTVDVVYVHLYANAFRNTRSTFLREAAAAGWERPDDMRFGGIDVQEAALATGEPLTLEFVSPDDGNPDDRTVARVELPHDVGPGESVSLRFTFTTTLPSVVARMGSHEDFVMAAQWFPKLGRRPAGRPGGAHAGAGHLREGWYCHQYHRNTEFHADFADYDVTLHVPDDVIVGATGTRTSAKPGERGASRVEVWEARSVVDFAWTASPAFSKHVRELLPLQAPARSSPDADPVLRERRRIATLLGVPEDSLVLPPVKVTVLLQPEHERHLDRHFEAARVALGLYGLWLGPYPYETLTIVDPAHGARRAGGMEYPQLVTAGARIASPQATLQPEGVIVHEIGHQWFMGMLASNEAEEAWLDEGFTTYFTARALDIAHGPALESVRLLDVPLLVRQLVDFPGLSAGWPEWLGAPDWAAPPQLDVLRAWRDLPPLTGLATPRYRDDPLEPSRRRYLGREGWDPATTAGWEFADRRSYGVNAYARPALFIATLRRTLHARLGPDAGERAFVLAVREYARTWRFRHPTGPDFLAAFSEASGVDARPLAAALLESTGALDYAIERIEAVHEPRLAGWVDGPDGVIHEEPDESNDGDDGRAAERSAVVVRRVGEVIVPMRLQVTRQNAPPEEAGWETVEWDGRERWRRFPFDGRITMARLQPDAEYLQDRSRRNDSRRRDPDHRAGLKWSVRFLLWLENAALSYGRFL